LAFPKGFILVQAKAETPRVVCNPFSEVTPVISAVFYCLNGSDKFIGEGITYGPKSQKTIITRGYFDDRLRKCM
jgi:hypothetical protein